MKKQILFPLFLGCLSALGLACNLAAASAQPGQTPIGNPTAELAATAQETPITTPEPTAIAGATAGPTPTLVPAGSCPPFAFDSFVADFTGINDPALFVGKHYNPEDYRRVATGNMGQMLDEVHGLDEFRQDNRYVVFLDRLVCRNSGGKAYFEIKNALILNLEKDQSIVRTCWMGESPVQPVLAVGHVDFTQRQQVFMDTTGWRYDRLDEVYRLDLEREIFSPLPLDGLVCLQPPEGGD